MLFHECQDCRRDLIIGDRNDVIDVLAANFKGQATRLFDSNTVGNGSNAAKLLDLLILDRFQHGGGTLCLHAVDLDIWLDHFDGIGNARNKSAAADGNDNGIHIRDLLHELERDGSLPRNDILIVKGVDKGISLFVTQLQCFFISVVVNALNEAHLGTVALGCLDLGDWCAVGQADDSLDAVALCRKCHALCVVARRAGDHAARFFFIGQT